MNLLFGIAGTAALVLFLARRFVRHRTTFGEFKERRDGHCAATLAALRSEAAGMNADEAMAPVIAGVRELLHISGRSDDPKMRVEKTADGPRLMLYASEAETAPCAEIAWVLRSVRVRKGTGEMRRGYWELHRPGRVVQRYGDLAGLMHEIGKTLPEQDRNLASRYC